MQSKITHVPAFPWSQFKNLCFPELGLCLTFTRLMGDIIGKMDR